MSCLHACPSCSRHVRSIETACPFCGTALPGACIAPDAPPRGRVATRAAITFFAAAAIAACGKSAKQEDSQVTAYGVPPINVAPSDAGADATKDGAK